MFRAVAGLGDDHVGGTFLVNVLQIILMSAVLGASSFARADGISGAGSQALSVGMAQPSTDRPQVNRQNVRAKPSAPINEWLLLGGLGRLSNSQLSRSMKRLYQGAVPDWYCGGGRQQIGHAFAVDPNLQSILSPCQAVPADDDRSPIRLAHAVASRHQAERDSRAVAVPRGPP